MAKTLHTKPHEVLYCPKESDWEGYAKYKDINYDWADILSIKRARKKAGTWNTYKKPPMPNENAHLIYNHRFLRIPNLNPSLFNNTISLNTYLQNPKKLLNRMEETYWSNWKPNKIKSPQTINRKTKRQQKERTEDKAPRPEKEPTQLIDYFAKSNFSISTQSEDNRPMPCRPETDKCDYNHTAQDPSSPNRSLSSNKTYCVRSTASAEVLSANKQQSHVLIPGDNENDSSTRIKILQHNDSLVLARKMQEAPKVHLRQPKCIKLYKNKPKGGSYPLAPVGKKNPNVKGSFRLAAPGSPVLITGNSLGGSSGRRRNKSGY
ncbi:unnamed protein product [Phyllotreta striolata]|uniref:Uncharacterized protein n=1 Tax=Phyllotreta striolata TaxID=444603 RepID=A0A9N9XLN4_PHYSR|nr:unnamed protein product [Phyllotreta striolata]